MFDIGFTELILLAGMGLIVLGPQRLPKVAAQLGRWVGQARRMSRTLMYQLRQEVDLDDPKPFSTRRPAESSKRPNPNTAHKETDSGKKEAGGDKMKADSGKKEADSGKKEAGGDKQETPADTAQSPSGDGAGKSQSGE